MRAAIGALLAVLALSGCGADESSPSTEFEVAADEASPSVDEIDMKVIARDAIRSQDSQFSLMSDGSLDRIFEIACEGFDTGLSAEQVATAGMPTFGDSVGAVMMGAVSGYCPEHRILVDVWMEQYS